MAIASVIPAAKMIEKTLDCGVLRMAIDRSLVPPEELFGFGNRRNRKRGFLFISKVLGKHYPVRPRQMRRIHEMLARQVDDLPSPFVVIGMAETAIALGQGVYEAMWRLGMREGVFLHSTRYVFPQPLAFAFEEQHSHATEHLLYLPREEEAARLFREARALVFVDDEMSTGKTLCNLLAACRTSCPRVEEARFVSITDWLSDARRREIEAQFPDLAIRFHNILEGSFSFVPNESFDCQASASAVGAGECKATRVGGDFGRFGCREPLAFDFSSWPGRYGLSSGDRLLVLGTGEFMYPAFLFADYLEEAGFDVVFQSSTRSPILVGEDVGSMVETVDNYGDGIPNFVYNVRPGAYDRILAGYESRPLPPEHDLLEKLGAEGIFFA